MSRLDASPASAPPPEAALPAVQRNIAAKSSEVDSTALRARPVSAGDLPETDPFNALVAPLAPFRFMAAQFLWAVEPLAGMLGVEQVARWAEGLESPSRRADGPR